jgi:glycerol-3-phosphate acyltransferase PlsY
MSAFSITALVAFSYLLGSVPSGIVAARLWKGPDPRTAGSRNIGATNVARTSGKAAGGATLAGDVLKGFLPTFFAIYYFGDPAIAAAVGLASFIGHLFPIFLRFKGGKGVATACGVMFAVSPVATLLSLFIFIVIVGATRYVSIGSMVAAASMPAFLGLFAKNFAYVYLGVAVAVLIIIKHSANIKRLLDGTENRFK